MPPKKRGRPPLPLAERVLGHSVYLTGEQWQYLELWGDTPTDAVRALLERAEKFWPAGPARFR